MAPKRGGSLIGELLRSGVVEDGELIRYKNKQGKLLAVGRAREGGIEVNGSSQLLNYTAFEARAGSKYHRPAEHSHTTTGKSLQQAQLQAVGGGSGGGGAAAAPKRACPATPLLEDESDEFCHVCGQGGDLMCCETCPATFHTGCMGLAALPEGDWHCPACRCVACGDGLAGGALADPGCAWLPCEGARYRGPEEGLAGVGRPFAGSAAQAAALAPGAATPLAPGHAVHSMVQVTADGMSESQPAAAAAGQPPGGVSLDALTEAMLAPLAAAPVEPAAAAAAGAGAEVRCPGTGRRQHVACLPPPGLQQQPWFSSPAAGEVALRLARLCCRGAVPLGQLADGTPLAFQLVRGAAAAAPGTCRGFAPRLGEGPQRAGARRLLSAALHVLHASYAPVADSRTGADAVPWMVRGAVLAGGAVDLSSMHTALLSAGSAVIGAACVRALGAAVGEVPALAVIPSLRGNGLGALLAAAVEAVLAGAGVGAVATPAFLGPGHPYLAAYAAHAAAQGQAAPPLMQGRLGYALATAGQMAELCAYPLVLMPGLLLCWKDLTPASVGPLPRLPAALVLNLASDARQLVKDGLAESVARPMAGVARLRAEASLEADAAMAEGGAAKEELPIPPPITLQAAGTDVDMKGGCEEGAGGGEEGATETGAAGYGEEAQRAKEEGAWS